MYLSYSGFKKGEDCMYAYWHCYINSTSFGVPDDRLGSIFGSSIGMIFEQFYMERLWRIPGTRKVLEDRVEQIVDFVLDREQKPNKNKPAGVILWRGEGPGQNPRGLYGSRDELVRDVSFCIANGLNTIKQFLLISKRPQAEMKLHADIEGHRIGGYADFVLDQVKTGHILILDGKGSRRRERYVEEDQLTWYSMLYQVKFGRLPDRTGFLYWRYEPPVSLDWVDPTQATVDTLKDKVLRRISKIEKATAKLPERPTLDVVQELFKPKATFDNCMFCPYATQELCPKGFEKAEALKAKRAAQQI